MSGCSSCNICQDYSCDSCNSRTQKFKPTFTIERACKIIHMLLGTQQCGTICPDWELCRLMKFQCELHCGRYQLAPLAMLTAAMMLETESLEYARSGRFKTLTIEIQADRTAALLMKQAAIWKKEATACTGIPKFHLARTGRGCAPQFKQAFGNSGCHQYQYETNDAYRLTNCNWDCCDDCDEIEVIPEDGLIPEIIIIPEGRENVPL